MASDINEYENYDYMIINSPMDKKVFPLVIKAISEKAERSTGLVLIIVTYGGLPNEAFRVGRFLQDAYDDMVVFIPSICKSAGTLLACSARKIIFGIFGELGPLDVQLRKRDELFGRRSGLNTVAAIKGLESHTFSIFEHFMWSIIDTTRGAVSFRTASQLAASTASGIMGNVYSQIDLEALGEDSRDLSVATEYCKRLSAKYGNINNSGISKLVNDYPSHDFVIDYRESKSIFNSVDLDNSVMNKAMDFKSGWLYTPQDTDNAIVQYLEFTGGDDEQGESDIEANSNGSSEQGSCDQAVSSGNHPGDQEGDHSAEP